MSVGLQSSGQISFADLRSEMGASGAQVSYSTLYRGSGYTPSTATSIPLSTSGNIWSMGSRTGGQTGDFYVRRMTIYGK